MWAPDLPDPASESSSSVVDETRWLRKHGHRVEKWYRYTGTVERLQHENQQLSRQLETLARQAHYQAGQIQQIDRRIDDAVQARLLARLADPGTGPSPEPSDRTDVATARASFRPRAKRRRD